MNQSEQKPLILVFHPHVRPGWAESFANEAQVITGWINGYYDHNCNAGHNEFMAKKYGDEDESWPEPTFDDAVSDLEHDLNSLTVLRSAAEYREYIARPGHNRALGSTAKAARELGWAE